ncbi:hypothetical protein F4810DRAFT_712511 [Camillea tinctor]|nr:hypothetical protein F4810DRAFT_712511 [Camillea tinctor]
MRLLTLRENGELALTANISGNVPPYAILSHTWGEDDDEVTFKDIEKGYFWVDTCCIDKSNSTELAEAINSMFKWYQNAERCYVYLADVPPKDHQTFGYMLRSTWEPYFRKCTWFTRDWTLQELIAPPKVEFFSAQRQRLGDKNSLEKLLHDITRIDKAALRGRALSEFTVSQRMSWSEGRETKREEDRAYSLLGIFNVYLPLLYSEGVDNAFRRLEKEIYCPSPNRADGLSFNRHVSTRQASLRKGLLDLLYFEDSDIRLRNLKSPNRKTCQWILEKEQFKDWVTAANWDDHRGFLWIKGKPGAGKSTLMKFLCRQTIKAATSDENTIVAPFFFNAQGGLLQKSTTSLYRSLLYRILSKAKDLQSILDEFNHRAYDAFRENGWPLETLKETLVQAVERLGHRKLQVFIDALDEGQDDTMNDMVSFFEEISGYAEDSNVQFQVCFSSRHYPAIMSRWGRQIILEDEKDHSADIDQYIRSELTLTDSSQVDYLRSKILQKSEGVFLWVVLVVQMLNKKYANGRVDEFQKCIDDLPHTLDDLFKLALRKDQDDIPKLQLSIQLILFAKRPMLAEEYFFAMRTPDSPETNRLWDKGQISHGDMSRFVNSSSKGLAMLVFTRGSGKQKTVQFIHESVRDYFLVNGGYSELWPGLKRDLFITKSHKTLRDRCLAEINSSIKNNTLESLLQSIWPSPGTSKRKIDGLEYNPPRNLLPESFLEQFALRLLVAYKLPFLGYAIYNVFNHAGATMADELNYLAFMKGFPPNYWIFLVKLFKRYRTYTDDRLLHIFRSHDEDQETLLVFYNRLHGGRPVEVEEPSAENYLGF